MAIDPTEFRRVLGHWITGVSVLASRTDTGQPCGLTANAVTSLSLDPPLVLACVDRSANSHDCIHRAGIFTINVLRSDGESIARLFADGDSEGRFDNVSWHPSPGGAPILEDALAWVDCRVRDVHPGGDHTIFIGEVKAAGTSAGDPLIYYRGRYGRHDSGR